MLKKKWMQTKSNYENRGKALVNNKKWCQLCLQCLTVKVNWVTFTNFCIWRLSQWAHFVYTLTRAEWRDRICQIQTEHKLTYLMQIQFLKIKNWGVDLRPSGSSKLYPLCSFRIIRVCSAFLFLDDEKMLIFLLPLKGSFPFFSFNALCISLVKKSIQLFQWISFFPILHLKKLPWEILKIMTSWRKTNLM